MPQQTSWQHLRARPSVYTVTTTVKAWEGNHSGQGAGECNTDPQPPVPMGNEPNHFRADRKPQVFELCALKTTQCPLPKQTWSNNLVGRISDCIAEIQTAYTGQHFCLIWPQWNFGVSIPLTHWHQSTRNIVTWMPLPWSSCLNYAQKWKFQIAHCTLQGMTFKRSLLSG